ncbi:MAG: hypothetical protein KC416_15695, partial [Myxococcales bacterium]|nr:hypothetical protein [Myxococcales bacterium]
GRFREEELLIDPESGDHLGMEAAQTESIPRVDLGSDTKIDDGIALQEAMLESGKVEACFARSYFRFTFGRAEDITRDGCALAAMHGAFEAGEPLESILERIAHTPAFRQRNFGD